MAKCLTGFKRYVHNLAEFPLLYAISRLVLDISGTKKPLGTYFHSDVCYNAPQNTVFFSRGSTNNIYSFTIL